MDTGWIVSGIMMGIILAIIIPMVRKFIVRENRKINYKKQRYICAGMFLIQ